MPSLFSALPWAITWLSAKARYQKRYSKLLQRVPRSKTVLAFEQALNQGRSLEVIADSLWEAGWTNEKFGQALPSADTMLCVCPELRQVRETIPVKTAEDTCAHLLLVCHAWLMDFGQIEFLWLSP